MTPIQIIITLFVLFVWWRLFSRWKNNEINYKEFTGWFLFWLVVGLVGVLPESTSYLATILGVGRGADVVVYLSLLIIFYLLFKIFSRLEKNDRQVTKIVRDLAIKNYKEKQ